MEAHVATPEKARGRCVAPPQNTVKVRRRQLVCWLNLFRVFELKLGTEVSC